MGPEYGADEIACQSQLGGLVTSGGGFSTYYPTPSWQQSAVSAYFANLTASNNLPAPGYNPNGRGIPDVSLIGTNYQVVINGALVEEWGTSCSTAVFAGMLSLVNVARAKLGERAAGAAG